MEEKYTAVTCGLEDVDKMDEAGIVEGSLDCVLSIQVLCSVADPAAAVQRIHSLLKEGGELVFWEHGDSRDWVTRRAQCE